MLTMIFLSLCRAALTQLLLSTRTTGRLRVAAHGGHGVPDVRPWGVSSKGLDSTPTDHILIRKHTRLRLEYKARAL